MLFEATIWSTMSWEKKVARKRADAYRDKMAEVLKQLMANRKTPEKDALAMTSETMLLHLVSDCKIRRRMFRDGGIYYLINLSWTSIKEEQGYLDSLKGTEDVLNQLKANRKTSEKDAVALMKDITATAGIPDDLLRHLVQTNQIQRVVEHDNSVFFYCTSP